MRVKISTNPPLPPVRAWFPLTFPSVQSTPTISSIKSLLCTSLPAFHGVSPSSLRLSIDGFELLDKSELTVVRDGDLICVDVLDVPSQDASARDRDGSHATQQRLEPAASRKRKRRLSTPGSSSSESETTESTTSASESESESDTSDSDTTSDSDESSRPTTPSLRKTEPPKVHVRQRAQVTPSVQVKPHVVHPSTFVPPGHGKPQTQARNLRRRVKRIHEREAIDVSQGGPVTGANAIVGCKDAQAQAITPESSQDPYSGLLSLSLRNKNKAKNFKSLIGRPLAPKIIFGDQEGGASASTSGAMGTPEQTASTRALPRLIPPSSRSSLPPNVFVTSIDVEAGMQREKKKRKMRTEYGDETVEDADITLDYGEAPETEVARLETIANKGWGTLEKLTSEEQVTQGMIVGYKGLAIDPITYTPEQRLTIGRVVSCDSKGVVIQFLRAREQVSFSGPVEEQRGEEEAVEWRDVLDADWRAVG